MRRINFSSCIVACLFLLLSWHVPARTQYYKERERTYDVLHYNLEIAVNLHKKSVEGTVGIRLTPLQDIAIVELDAAEMTILSTGLSTRGGGTLELAHRLDGQKLRVILPAKISNIDTIALSIKYACSPKIGMFFIAPDKAYPNKPLQAWSQGEMEDNHYWFPCYDYPNDKATVEMHVTVDEQLTVISNGGFTGTDAHPATHTKTVSWSSNKPISSYLISLVVGDYKELADSYKSIPVQYYVYPLQEGEALRSFAKTPAMIALFSERIGFDYPWPKYAQTVVADFSYGGMENTSATTLTDMTIHSARAALDVTSDNLVAHELAHQWFGDLLTCRNWSNAWLNEGFASYFQALWVEHEKGLDAFQQDMFAKHRSVIEADTGIDRRATVSNDYVDPSEVFDSRIYARGASLLHMLRFILGEKVFWQGIRHYVETHTYQTVTSADLQHSLEDVFAENLDWFFQEWVYKAGFPIYDVSSAYDPAVKKLRVTVRQVQKTDALTPLYRMPLIIGVSTEDGDRDFKVMTEAAYEQTIELPLPKPPLNVVFDKGGWLLKELHQQKTIGEWLVQLRNGDAVARIEALRTLETWVDVDSVLTAIGRTVEHDPFWGVREQAAESLKKAKDARAIVLLAPAFRDSSAEVRVEATKSLGNFKDLDALVALGNIFKTDSSYAVAAEAISSLVKIDPANGMRYIEKGLAINSHNDIVRAAAVRALGTLKTAEAKKQLMKFTKYGYALEVRLAAIEALADSFHSTAMLRKRMEQLTDDPVERVRRKAVAALGTLASRDAIPALTDIRDTDRDGLIRAEARRSMRKIERQLTPR